jgi:cell shape-determining protein MreC
MRIIVLMLCISSACFALDNERLKQELQLLTDKIEKPIKLKEENKSTKRELPKSEESPQPKIENLDKKYF